MAKFFLVLMYLFALSFISSATFPSIRTGFYSKTCPSAEAIVKSVVDKAYTQDSGIAAALLRLHFHDCFVRGCDASLLLDSTTTNRAEKESMGNKGVGGFEVIDEAKAQIEAQCPTTVSCADIVAFAARDSIVKARGLYYLVPAGRRDGRVSLINEVTQNLPGEFFNATQLKLNFAKKGLSLDDMVILSGAHSIGDSHCSSFDTRLYSFNATYKQDPSLDVTYASQLKRQCPRPVGPIADPLVSFDPMTPVILDNQYYHNLKINKGLLASDQALWTSPITRGMVRSNANHPSKWASKFSSSMVRMGSIDVLTGNQGEVRKNCRIIN